VFVREEIERAVDLQARGYRLLRWLESAFASAFVAPETVHVDATLEAAARAWIERRYLDLPSDARPGREDIVAFANLFSTYLTNSFDLDANPGERLYSPDNHCYCFSCSWMVAVPHLQPKKLGSADKDVAERLKRELVRRLAASAQRQLDDETIDRMLRDPELREALGLGAYAWDLLERLNGTAVGPATLALWRSFAWTPQGSPKKGFALSAAAILDAERVLLERIAAG
jgi:hypothetical protein